MPINIFFLFTTGKSQICFFFINRTAVDKLLFINTFEGFLFMCKIRSSFNSAEKGF